MLDQIRFISINFGLLKRRRYILPNPNHSSGASREHPRYFVRYWKHLLWIVPLILVDLFLIRSLINRKTQIGKMIEEPLLESLVIAPHSGPVPIWKNFVFPTAQERLLEGVTAEIFQTTASGNPESSLYGSVRTVKNGQGLMSSFHEGIDIAAIQRDRHGRPIDTVRAVADGLVAYVNRIGGNSNYGMYVVLLHNDPMGEVYTLYAHLAEVSRTLRVGQNVSTGDTIGLMGNTSSAGIPMSRAHLHFEIGLINNHRFVSWYRAHKLKPDHGNFHGRNFFGVDPLSFIAGLQRNPNLDFRSHLTTLPTAFEIAMAVSKQLDFFRRYPLLWAGPTFDGSPIVLSCTENGLPLRGRLSTVAEQQTMGKQKCVVLKVDESVLGRNGCHLITKTATGWRLGPRGGKWLEILTY